MGPYQQDAEGGGDGTHDEAEEQGEAHSLQSTGPEWREMTGPTD